MKYSKWVLISAGSAVAVVLLAVIGIQFYLNTEQARQRIQAWVNQAIPGTLTWSQSSFSILDGKAALHHVVLTGPKNDPLLELERVFIHLSYRGLLKGELTVYDLLLEKPKVSLVKDRSGNLNLIQALYIPEGKPLKSVKNSRLPFNITLRRLNVKHGFIRYHTAKEDAENPTDHMLFQNVDLTVIDGNLLKQSGRLVCQIAGGEIQSKKRRIVIDQLSLKADVQKDRIDALLVDVNTDGIHASVTGSVENLFTGKPSLDLGLNSRISLSKIKDLMILGPGFSGAVHVKSTLKGTLDNPKIDAVLGYEGGNLAGNRIDQIHLNCRFKEKILHIGDLYVFTPLGKINIKGDVDFRKALGDGLLTVNPDLNTLLYKFSIHQKDLQLARLSTGISGLKGVATADIELEGQGVKPNTFWAKTALELYINNLSAGEEHSPLSVHLITHADIQKGLVTIQHLTADTGISRLEMYGNYDVPSHQMAVHFKLEIPELTEVMTILGINGVLGSMNMSGEVSGTVQEPSMAAQLNGENLGFRDIRFGKLDVNIRLANGRFSLEQGKILNNNSQLDISGSAGILDPGGHKFVKNPDFDVALNGDTLFLEDFVQGMQGKFVLNGRANGSTLHPKGQLSLSGENVDLSIQKFRKIELTATIVGRQIHMKPLSLVIAPGEKILLNGWISMDKTYDLSITSSNISLKNIGKMASWKVDWGKISVDISGKGEFADPRLKGKFVFSDLSFNDQRLGQVPFEIKLEDQTAYISGGLNFTLDVTYGLQSRSFSTSARFDNTDLTPYLQLVGKKELNGAISGNIELKGNIGTPIRIEGTTRISQLSVFWKNTPLIKGNDLLLFVQNDEISIPGMQLSLVDKGGITMKGSGKLSSDLDLEAEGNIPFEILPMLTETPYDATGEARFSLKVNGSLSTPNVMVRAEIIDGGMTIPGLLQKLRSINGNVRMTANAIFIDGIKGMLDSGKFELNGTIDLARYQVSNITLNMTIDDLPITVPDRFDVQLNAVLDVQGSPKKSLIKGDVELVEGTYEKDVRLSLIESIGQESREEPLVTSNTPWPILSNMALDCSIRYRDPFVVDNNIALLTIKPDLHIYGTVNQPLISGRAEVESGTVYFQRNEFNIIKGVFDFINPYKIEPTIDIQSEVKVREWTVFLEISGTPEALRFDMISDPQESAEDILSLLISGKTTQELIAREGGSALSPRQMLADVLDQTIQKEIKNVTGLDVVELEYNEAADADATDEVKVAVGKALSRNVAVKYDVQTKNAKVIQRVITEYKFIEKLMMTAFQDTEGHYGGGVQFRLEFR